MKDALGKGLLGPEDLLPAAASGGATGVEPLGMLAVKMGLISTPRLAECLSEQRRRAARGRHGPLGRIMVELGCLRTEDVENIVRLQGRCSGEEAVASISGELAGLRRYRDLEPIGSGGDGTVYRALDLELNRVVAIKVLRDPPSGARALERFRRETQIIAALRHPNIVAIHDVGQLGGHWFYTMQHVAGESLENLLRRKGCGLKALNGDGPFRARMRVRYWLTLYHLEMNPTVSVGAHLSPLLQENERMREVWRRAQSEWTALEASFPLSELPEGREYVRFAQAVRKAFGEGKGEAEGELEALARGKTLRVESIFALGMIRFAARRFDEAIRTWRPLAEERPGLARLLQLLGHAHMAAGLSKATASGDPQDHYLEAIRYFDGALKGRDPSFALLGFAVTHRLLGEWKAARGHDPRSHYVAVIDRCAGMPSSHPLAAVLLCELGNTYGRLGEWAEAHEEDPFDHYRAGGRRSRLSGGRHVP